MPYCLPWTWPALTMKGFRCLKFLSSFGFQGCTRPLSAKYFVQPTYGRNRSGLRPAWSFASASDSFVMYVNCGLLCGWFLTYCANIDWPPSLPYPAQSRTWSLPLSLVRLVRAASATAAGPPRIAAPPATAASLRSSLRLRWPSSRPLSVLTGTPFALCAPARSRTHLEAAVNLGLAHRIGANRNREGGHHGCKADSGGLPQPHAVSRRAGRCEGDRVLQAGV